MTPPPSRLADSIRAHLGVLLGLLAIMWAVELLDLLPFLHLDRFGIRPRTLPGLAGILFAPFLHAGFGHLMLNSLPFLILGGVVLLGGMSVFWKVTAFVALLGGLGVWLFAGRETVHLGASGVIFGYLGFVLTRGIFEKSAVWIGIAAAILFVYGSLLWGVLPQKTGVSWQGHLFGFLAGIAAARLLFPREKTILR